MKTELLGIHTTSSLNQTKPYGNCAKCARDSKQLRDGLCIDCIKERFKFYQDLINDIQELLYKDSAQPSQMTRDALIKVLQDRLKFKKMYIQVVEELFK